MRTLIVVNLLLLIILCQAKVIAAGDDTKVSPKLEELIAKANSSDSLKRANAIQELGAMGADAVPAIPTLIRALKDHTRFMKSGGPLGTNSSTSTAELARFALARIGPVAIDPLIEALKNNRIIDIRVGAAKTLGTIADRSAVEPLIEMTDDKEPRIRAASIRALSSLQLEQGFELSDEENEILRDRIAGPVIAAMQKSVKEKSYVVQEACVKALSRRKDKAIIELLIAIVEQTPPVEIKRGDTYSRRAATRTKQSREERKAWAKARKAAIQAATKTKQSREDRKAWTKARKAAIQAMWDIKDDRVVTSLVGIMKNEKDVNQKDAIRALGFIRNDAAIEALIEALDDKGYSSDAHNVIIGCLGQIPDRRVVETLLGEYKNKGTGKDEKGKSYALAGNKFKSLKEVQEWWQRAMQRLEQKQEWWWVDPPDEAEAAKYATMKKTMLNGQVYVGMTISDLTKLWGKPKIHMSRGAGKSFMVYIYEVDKVRSLIVNYENQQIVNIVDNMSNEVPLKDKYKSD